VDGRRAGAWRWTGAGAAGAVLVAGAVVPDTRTAAVLVASVLATAAPLAGLLISRAPVRTPFVAVSAMLALWTAGMVTVAIAPGAVPAGGLLIEAGAVVAAVLVGLLFLHQRRSGAPSGSTRSRLEALGHRADQVVVGCVLVLGAVQVATTAAHHLSTDHWAAAIAPLDVVLAVLLLRFAFSRQRVPVAGVLALGAALVTAVYDTLVTSGGTRIAGPDDALNVLWVGAACLFVASSLHPSAPEVFQPDTLRSRRSESARLLGLVPLAAAPVALHAIASRSAGVQLPVSVYLATGALIGVLAILRGAQAVAATERRAEQDTLTGTANRRGLARAFGRLVDEAGGPGRLLLLDVDDFKHVNDTLGHAAGDDLLVGIGRRLGAAVGPHGTVARSGGDEFVVLLAAGAPAPGQLVAEVFGVPFDVLAGPARVPRTVRVSGGWTPVGPGSDLSHSLADADVALYAAKGAGKNSVTMFRPELREDVLGRLALVEDLRRLLADEPGAGRLEPHYQPLVELAGGRVVGCEALVRWAHPDRGLLCPDAFLDLAEEHGLGARLDAWMLTESLAQLARWDAAGLPPVFVSVNLGCSAVTDPDLAGTVERALAGSGIAPGRLHLEITEHAELPTGAGAEALHALAARGVRVSLDDFGVGYTSLDYVRLYPVTTLKADRSITAPLQEEQTSPLLRGVVLLAGEVGMEVLAEGIETPLQRDRLLSLGVRLGQGYLFARPLTAAGFATHLRATPAPDVPRPRAALDPEVERAG